MSSAKANQGRLEKENSSRGSPNALYNKKLQDALNKFVQQHQEYQQDNSQKSFWEDHHRIVFTPPYTPALQPKELLWFEVKRRFANRLEYGRTITQTKLQMLDSSNGIEEDDFEAGIFVIGDEDDISFAQKENTISKDLVNS